MVRFAFKKTFWKQALKMASQFSIHIWTSIYAGIILAFPYIIYEFWKFISPGLKENERKSSQGFIIFASVLFFIGVIFGYYVITPLSINFLGGYQVSDEVVNQFELESYIAVVRTAVLASGIILSCRLLCLFLRKLVW